MADTRTPQEKFNARQQEEAYAESIRARVTSLNEALATAALVNMYTDLDLRSQRVIGREDCPFILVVRIGARL